MGRVGVRGGGEGGGGARVIFFTKDQNLKT